MPYLITTSLYPADKANEVAEKYLEIIQKLTPDESLGTELVPAAVKTTEKGIQVISVFEVKAGKLEQALLQNTNFRHPFLSIQGYNYNTQVNFTLSEALGVLGISAPE